MLPKQVTYITPEDPSSEICGETAAAFAAGSMALRDTDPEYADTLVEHAKQAGLFETYSPPPAGSNAGQEGTMTGAAALTCCPVLWAHELMLRLA